MIGRRRSWSTTHASSTALGRRARLAAAVGRAALIASLLVCRVVAQEQKEATAPAASDQSAELAKKLQNPVAALISVPFQSNFEWGSGPHSDGFKYTLNFQPVVPISISESWNVISRTIVPVIEQDDLIPGTSQGGLGDIVQSLFLSPKAPGWGGIIWGVGPVFLLPTSTEDFLGAQKFGIGPTGVALRQSHGWTYGLLFNHIFSIGGTSATSDVNATFLQPFLSYTTKTYTTFGIQTESTYDWENSKWTVPLIAPVSQLLKIRGLPVSLQLGPKVYVEGPRGAPDWGIRFAFVLLFPK
jgi:hypothetical protein